jgi:hypothetical protein
MDEAIGIAQRSGARHVLLTHYPSARREALLAAASATMTAAASSPTSPTVGTSPTQVSIAVPGMELEISAATEHAPETATASEAASQPWTLSVRDASAI